MKYGLFVFALVSVAAMAAGYGGAQGENRRGEWVSLEGELAEFIRVRKGDFNSEVIEEYSLGEECPAFFEIFGVAQQFSCPKEGKSPLAGATYKVAIKDDYLPCDVEPNFYKDPGEVYICVEGCDNERVPLIFYVAPYECV